MSAAIESAWTRDIEGDPKEGITRLIAEHVHTIAGDRVVGTVGISLKGPLRYRDDGALVGPWVVPPFDSPWPFEVRLRDSLDESGVAFGHVRILLDSVAAALGEMHQARGTLAGRASGVIFIWGTGIGCTLVENGTVLEDVGQDEPGNDRRRLYTSPGRHLVYRQDGYTWEPIPLGQSKATLRDDEMWMSERLGGAWLPARVALRLSGIDPHRSARTLAAMAAGLTGIELRDYAVTRGDADMERKLLEGLTRAASGGDEWARSELAAIGSEFGTALAAFVWEFWSYRAVENIVLVSSIAEKLGKGVRGPGVEEDLLMHSLRDGLAAALTARGVDAARARLIAFGVERSRIGREREYLAFDRSDSRLVGRESSDGTDKLIHP